MDGTTVNNTDPTPQDPAANTAPDENTETQTYTKEQVEEIVKSRLARDRKQFADYDVLKTKAAKLDEIEEANKTELQKATDQIADLQSQIAAAKQRELINTVAIKYGIPADYMDMLHGTDEETLEAQATKLQALLKPAQKPVMREEPPSGGHSPFIGSAPSQDTTDVNQLIAKTQSDPNLTPRERAERLSKYELLRAFSTQRKQN